MLNLTPVLEVSPHDVLRLKPCSRLLYSANVQRSVQPVEAANTTHIVSVVRELFTAEAVA